MKNDWDHVVGRDAVDGTVVCISRDEVVKTLKVLIIGQSPGPSDVSLKLIAAIRKV